MAVVDIARSQGYLLSRSQEVPVGTADRNCRASRSSRTRPEGVASSTRGIQHYNRVTEGKEHRRHQDRPGEEALPPGYRKTPDWKVVPGHASAIPAAPPSRADLRTNKAGPVGR
jgi:hypothetical protein